MSNEEKFPTEFYDIIINIDSFENLKYYNKGWKIEMSEEGQAKYEKYANKNESKNHIKLNRIGILGESGVGKTYILGKIINKENLIKYHIPTKGISVIYPQNEDKPFVCIDSQGSEEPIIDINDSNIMTSLSGPEREKKIKEIATDKNFTEIFIQDFIIKKSNIFIVVVDQLNFSEQKLINRLKKENFEKLYIIHNTQYLTDLKSIEDHIEKTVKKSVFSNLKKKSFTKMDDKKSNEQEPFYFLEKNIGNYNETINDEKQIIHLFMAKDGTNAGDFYNNKTIEFLRDSIAAATDKKEFDILNEIKKFLSEKSESYMIDTNNKNNSNQKCINEDDIKCNYFNNDDKENVCFKLVENKDFIFKECIIDEMGYSKIKENSITPAYSCYLGKYQKSNKEKKIEEEWDALIIKAEMFVDMKKIKINIPKHNEQNYSIIITCPKNFNKNDDIKVIKEIGGNIKEGEIKITIEYNFEKFILEDPKKKGNVVIKNPQKGIIMIYLKITKKIIAKDIKTENIKKTITTISKSNK